MASRWDLGPGALHALRLGPATAAEGHMSMRCSCECEPTERTSQRRKGHARASAAVWPHVARLAHNYGMVGSSIGHLTD